MIENILSRFFHKKVIQPTTTVVAPVGTAEQPITPNFASSIDQQAYEEAERRRKEREIVLPNGTAFFRPENTSQSRTSSNQEQSLTDEELLSRSQKIALLREALDKRQTSPLQQPLDHTPHSTAKGKPRSLGY
jgi:hypothetical protein